jgi:hypothetical protein
VDTQTAFIVGVELTLIQFIEMQVVEDLQEISFLETSCFWRNVFTLLVFFFCVVELVFLDPSRDMCILHEMVEADFVTSSSDGPELMAGYFLSWEGSPV